MQLFNNIDCCFRLYQKSGSAIRSTFYDLIEGDTETKQTKALAFLLSKYPVLIQSIISMPQINKRIRDKLKDGYNDILEADYIQVDAEMIGEGTTGIRRDITITFYKNKRKSLVLIIEAKNIILNSRFNVEEQLASYMDPVNFPRDKDVPKLAVSLTRYNQVLDNQLDFISITWSNLIELVHLLLKDKRIKDTNNLLEDYYKFITGVDKNMRFFEKEVLSVPAGKTLEIIEKYNIHACPNTKNYNYKSSLFITFRMNNGGQMKTLYGIDDVIILNPHNASQIQSLKEMGLAYTDRILKYIEKREQGLGFGKGEEHRFYILSEKNKIELPHAPKPRANNSGGWYYSLSEMLNGKEFIDVNS